MDRTERRPTSARSKSNSAAAQNNSRATPVQQGFAGSQQQQQKRPFSSPFCRGAGARRVAQDGQARPHGPGQATRARGPRAHAHGAALHTALLVHTTTTATYYYKECYSKHCRARVRTLNCARPSTGRWLRATTRMPSSTPAHCTSEKWARGHEGTRARGHEGMRA